MASPARGLQASLPLGTALLTDAALSLLLWNLVLRLAVLMARIWPGLVLALA